MSKFIDIQNSFSKGMLSPKLRGRIDIPEYKQGAEEITNALGFKQGGLYRRPSTEYLADFTGDHDADLIIPLGADEFFLIMSQSNGGSNVRLAEFDGSSITYHQGQTAPTTGTFVLGWHKASIGEIAIDLHADYVTDYITIGKTTVITLNNNWPVVIYPTTYTTTAGVDYNFWHCHSILWPIDPSEYTFYRESSSTLYDKLSLQVPYLPVNTNTAKTMTPSGTGTGTITVTASFKIPDSDDWDKFVGRVLKITHGSTTGVGIITGIDTSTVETTIFTVRMQESPNGALTFGATTASNNWQISTVPDFDAVTVYQQRLFLAKDDTIYCSAIGNIQHFMADKLQQDIMSDTSGLSYFGDAADTDPFSFVIASREFEQIKWLETGDALEVGTNAKEYIVSATDSGAISPTNIRVSQQTSFGSYSHRPIKTNKSTITISKEQYFVRRFAKNIQTDDQYQTFELNLHSDNIIANAKFKKIIHQKESNVIWCLTENGELLSCTYHEEAQVIAWAKHDLGGTDVVVVDIIDDLFNGESTNFTDDGHIHLIVERTIDGGTVRYFEKLGLEFREADLNASDRLQAFMDSCIKIELASTNTVTGLGHLEGETIDVLVDGILEEDLVVSSGQVTTTNSGIEFVCGLPYDTTIKTMPIEVGSQFSTSQSSVKRISEVFFKFYNTKGVTVSDGEGTNAYPLEFGDETVSTLESGDLNKKVQVSPDYNNQFIVKQSKSLPMNLLAFVARGQSYD